MSIKTAKMQIRQGSAAEWTAANTLLLLGEWGLESDTGKFKLGDGVTLWNSLSYITNPLTAQVASAWVNFNGTGAVAIRDDFNVDSITDNNIGDYTVNIDVDLADANYAVVMSCQSNATTNRVYGAYKLGVVPTVSAFTIISFDESAGANVDPLIFSCHVFGGKA